MTGAGQPRLRIVSYNVHACVGRDGRFDPARIANVIESLDADFVALQEVEDREFEGQGVSDFLAARLDMHAYRGVTLRREDADYGNLLLARREAAKVRLHDLSVMGGEPRGCIEADFVVTGQRLRLFATHLGLRAGERLTQVNLLESALLKDDVDVTVLAGDINEWRPAAGALRALREMFGPGRHHRTFPSRMPMLGLDRIYVMPGDVVMDTGTRSTAECRVASDHLPLVCDLGHGRQP